VSPTQMITWQGQIFLTIGLNYSLTAAVFSHDIFVILFHEVRLGHTLYDVGSWRNWIQGRPKKTCWDCITDDREIGKFIYLFYLFMM